MKSLNECLDIILRRLVDDWNNYGDDRKELNAEAIMTSFGLDPAFRKHEFFVGIIDKLVKDGYAELLVPGRQCDSKISQYQKNTIITIAGYYFILKKGGYTKEAKRKWITDIPKTYWLPIAVVAFFVGFFSDIIKERWKAKSLSPSSKSEQEIPIISDNPQTHKNLHYRLDTFYIGVDTVYTKN